MKWIPVTERLPEDEMKVVFVKTLDDHGWEQVFAAWPGIEEDETYWLLDHPMTLDSKNGDVRIPGVTHWMDIPEAP